MSRRGVKGVVVHFLVFFFPLKPERHHLKTSFPIFSPFVSLFHRDTGLDVHRRIHSEAMRQLAYQAQWRAYCERCEPAHLESLHFIHSQKPNSPHHHLFLLVWERRRVSETFCFFIFFGPCTDDSYRLGDTTRRAKRDWRDMVTDEDETVLCSFQYELEQGLQRFEEAKAAGELSSWPPRTLHPTQGLPAIGAAYKAALEEICGGREKLFQTEYQGPGRRGFKMNRDADDAGGS